VLQNIIEEHIQVQRRPRDEVIFEAEELLKRVGLSEKRDSFPSRLSGGQKQRVGIARALAMKPDLLLFDEPTSALDPELVTEVVEVIKDLAKSGSTMVIVTHELGFAREVSSEVVFMAEGKIVEQSPPAQFFADPKTERTRQFIHRHLRGI
jgi:polar amino acid transport system ATP-binding protein